MNRLVIFMSFLLLSTAQIELIAQLSKLGLFILFGFNLMMMNKISHKFKGALLIWAVMIISVITSQDVIISITRYIYSAIVILSLIPLAIQFNTNPEKSLNQLFYVASIWIFWNCLMISSPSGYDNLGLFKGATYNANALGGILVLIYLPLCVFRLQQGTSILNWVFLFITLALVYLTKSRSAALCVFSVLLIVLTISRKGNVKTFFYGFLATASIVSANFAFISQEFIKYFVKYEFLNASSLLATRQNSWGIRLEAISRKPFLGWGFGVNPIFIDKDLALLYDVNVNLGNTEKGNSYLAAIEEFGLFTGSFILVLLFLLVRRVYKNSDFKNPQSLVVIIVLTLGCIHALFESWLFYIGSYSSLWFWVILLVGLTKNNFFLKSDKV